MIKILWTQKQDIGPSPRNEHVMDYDNVRKRVLLFGGANRYNDTWEWDGESWIQVADIGPSPLALHHLQNFSMAYDSDRGCFVMIRRIVSLLGAPPRVETWEWNGSNWTQVSDIGPLVVASLVYNQGDKRIVLAGGGETWEWDGIQWTQRDNGGPHGEGVLAYDSVRRKIVFFGGLNSSENLPAVETWEWDGDKWKHQTAFGPSPRNHGAMIYDSFRERTILFGGLLPATMESPSVSFNDTWEWDGIHWIQRQDMGPAPRSGHAMAYDIARKRLVLFGGYGNSGALGDTWELGEYPL